MTDKEKIKELEARIKKLEEMLKAIPVPYSYPVYVPIPQPYPTPTPWWNEWRWYSCACGKNYPHTCITCTYTVDELAPFKLTSLSDRLEVDFTNALGKGFLNGAE